MTFIKYKIQEHLFSFKKSYVITDEDDRLIGTINRHPFSPVKKATFYNSSEEEVLVIKKKLFSLRRTYFLEKDKAVAFKIFKTLGLKPTIFVESLTAPDAFVIEGNIWTSEYAFYKNDTEFAYVSRDIWKLADTFMAAIKDDEDQYLVLALVIIISLLRKSRKKS